MNEFLNISPTWKKTAATTWTSNNSNGVVTLTDPTVVDVASGIGSTIKAIFPSDIPNFCHIDFSSGITPFTMGNDDVWLLPFYLDKEQINTTGKVSIRISDSVDNLNTKYREVTWSKTSIKYGWQVLCAKHTEVNITLNQYGTIGTVYTGEGRWTEVGGALATDIIGAIQIKFIDFQNCSINFGSIWTAPSGWSKSVVMLGVDDAPRSFLDLVVPQIESYGWKCVFNLTIQNTLINTNIMVKDAEILRDNGHEIWGHGRNHFKFRTESDIIDKYDYYLKKKRELIHASKFWMSHGFPSAAKCMAMPYNAYDEEAFELLHNLGYRIARSSPGIFHQSWLPGIGRFTLPSLSADLPNSWAVDTQLNGAIERGQSVFLYGHAVYPGGTGINTYPQNTSSYADHWTRWLAFLRQKEIEGKVVVTTPIDYFKRCGLDIFTDTFVE